MMSLAPAPTGAPPFPKSFLALALCLLGAAAALSGCTPRAEYDVRGRVVGFGSDARTVIVEHEAIPDVMPAMTMPFTARDSAAVAALETGDAVAFTLVVTSNSSWIDDLRSLPDSAVARRPAGTPTRSTPGGSSPIIDVGDAVPSVELVDQNERPVSFADYDGRVLVVTFIYTRCPLPDYCPRMSNHFQTLQPRLQSRYGDRTALLSITFDPEYDSPSVLRDYARRYEADTTHWRFATGTPEEIRQVAEAFGVFYEANGPDIDHSLITALIGPEGRLRYRWIGNRWTPEDVLRAVDEVLDGQPSS